MKPTTETLDQVAHTLIWQGKIYTSEDSEPREYSGDPEQVDFSDLPEDVQTEIKEAFTGFLDNVEESSLVGTVWEDHTQVAHDWVLTSYRHGAGFWDRYSPTKTLDRYNLGQKLTTLSHDYPCPDVSFEFDEGAFMS